MCASRKIGKTQKRKKTEKEPAARYAHVDKYSSIGLVEINSKSITAM